MIIVQGRRFEERDFKDENELERVVLDNSEYIFGPDTISLGKRKISPSGGDGTIPDAIVIDITCKRWYIVEAELDCHDFWRHVAPQVSKQIAASMQRGTQERLIRLCIERIQESNEIMDSLARLGVPEIAIHRYIQEILNRDPIIAIPIDKTSQDLEDWAKTLRYDVRIWIIRKLVDPEHPDEPMFEIPDEEGYSVGNNTDQSAMKTFGVSISDLVKGAQLTVHEGLVMSYAPQGQPAVDYEATVSPSGGIQIGDRAFTSPSQAALSCMVDAGSTRRTVNGWTSWRTKVGNKLLSELREEHIKKKSTESDATEIASDGD